jgi:hypothetical protein
MWNVTQSKNEMVVMALRTEDGKCKQLAGYHEEWETCNVSSLVPSVFITVVLLTDIHDKGISQNET